MAEKCTSSTAEEPTSDDDPITGHAISAFAYLDGAAASAASAANDGGGTSFVPLLFTTPPTTTTTTPTNIPHGDIEPARRCCTTIIPSPQSTETVAMIHNNASSFSSSSSASVSDVLNGAEPLQQDDRAEILHGGKDEVSLAIVVVANDGMQEFESTNEDDDHESHATKITPTSSATAGDDEKVKIFLETPVAETNHPHQHHSNHQHRHHQNHHHKQHQDNTMNSHRQDVVVVVDAAANAENIELLMVVEASMSESAGIVTNAKRLSDEFFSADDGSDADNEEEDDDDIVTKRSNQLIDDEDSHPDAAKLSLTSMQSTNTPISVVNDQIPDSEEAQPHFDDGSNHTSAECDFRANLDHSSSHDQPTFSDSLTPAVPNSISNVDGDVANQGDELNEYFDHDVRSMDAIERRDIEEEHKITGGCLIRCRTTKKRGCSIMDIIETSTKKLDANSVNELGTKSPKVASPPAQPAGTSKMSTTPTSSRTKMLRFGLPTKSTASAKINLSESLEKAVMDGDMEYTEGSSSSQRSSNTAQKAATEAAEAVSSIVHSIINKLGSVANVDSIASSSTSNLATTMSAAVRIRLSQQRQKREASSFFNCSNSNDSSDTSNKSFRGINFKSGRRSDDTTTHVDGSQENLVKGSDMTISSSVQFDSHSVRDLDVEDAAKHLDGESENSKLAMACSSSKNYAAAASTSCNSSNVCNNFHSNVSSNNSLSNCSYSNRSSASHQDFGAAEDNTMDEEISRRPDDELVVGEEEIVPANEADESHVSHADASGAGSSSSDAQNFNPSNALIALENDHDYEEDTWADCEEMSDAEEVCTCRDYSDDETHMSSEDELPSRDVDLSGYTQLDTISEDILPESSNTSQAADSTPRTSYRKRRLTESKGEMSPRASSSDSTPGKRKRMHIESITSPPHHPSTPTTTGSQTYLQSPSILGSAGSERRTPRSMLIPTRENPPPELSNWLLQFQRWSHAERLLATDRLIEYCEPSQVRHMMKVIEPQFQRDFISLLPKELALQVLSFLDPRDLLRAAQTCRSWRFLCDDNLLWKDKCKQTNIVIEPNTDRPKRGRAGNMPHISSPWKAAYMRQTIIEMNWRSRPIRDPKVLKGHDDHVITCLQFCGNRIVSGSDDNTLKVWSAITGKCLRTLIGHTGGVWSSQMAGNCIISGSTDRTLKVWNAETGHCTHTLYGHTSTVRCMHLHGNKVVSGSRDATLRVWDIIQGKCLHILVGHLAAVRCVQYDGKLVVSGAYDYMVKVWNPERQECLHTLQGHTNRVYSLQFDGVHVVSGSLDTSIRVWDAETGSCKHTLMGHQSLTSGMELRQNILVSGNADSTVKVWDITNGQCLQTLSGPNKHQSAVTCLQFNSRFVITSSDDGTVKLWDVRTGDFIRNLVTLDSGGSGGVVWRIRANDTKLICAVGSRNGTEETKLMVLDFDVEGACLKCS